MGEKPKSEKKLKPIRPQQRRIFSNRNIILIKIASACLLFFCCCFFFFQNMSMFWADLTSYMAFFPVIYFIGVIFVCVYIAILVSTIERKKTMHGDRFDVAYRIVFTITLTALTIRSFFTTPMLNVPIVIISLAIFSGIVTWLTPKIRDNDNADF